MTRRALTLAFLLTPALLWAQIPEPPCNGGPGQDDVGMWAEASFTKRLSDRWSASAELELRTNDNVSNFSRFVAGASFAYRPLRWMKLSASYNWIYYETPTKIKNHYKDDIADAAHWNGYNVTHEFKSVKQRINLDLGMESPKLWRCIRVSLRERYQFTWRNPLDADRTKFRYKLVAMDDDFNPLPEPYYKLKDDPERDLNHKGYESSQVLRSRVKVSLDKKRCRWSPFVSYEFYNDLEDGLSLLKTRLCMGTEYKINRHNEIGIAYLFNTEYGDANERMHVVNISYGLKF